MHESEPTPAGDFSAEQPRLAEVSEFVDPTVAQTEEIPPHPATIIVDKMVDKGSPYVTVAKIYRSLYGDKRLTRDEKVEIFDVLGSDPRLQRVPGTTTYNIIDHTNQPEQHLTNPRPARKKPASNLAPIGGDLVEIAVDLNGMLRKWKHSIAGNVNQRKPSSGRRVHYKNGADMSGTGNDYDDDYDDQY